MLLLFLSQLAGIGSFVINFINLVKTRKKKTIPIIVLIFSLICLIGAGYGSFSKIKHLESVKLTQWYLQVDSVDVWAVTPNDRKDIPLRFVAVVNGQEYGFPNHTAWVHEKVIPIEDAKPNVPINGVFPLPLGVEQYQVVFSGYVLRHDTNGDEIAADLSGQDKVNFHRIDDLPITNGSFQL